MKQYVQNAIVTLAAKGYAIRAAEMGTAITSAAMILAAACIQKTMCIAMSAAIKDGSNGVQIVAGI